MAYRQHALRILRQPLSRLADDPDAKEEFGAAEEVVSVPKLQLDPEAVIIPSSEGEEAHNESARRTDRESLGREIGSYNVVHAELLESTPATAVLL